MGSKPPVAQVQNQRKAISCSLVGKIHALPIHFCHADAALSLMLTTHSLLDLHDLSCPSAA